MGGGQGWIRCTADNEPPKGFRCDALHRWEVVQWSPIWTLEWSMLVSWGSHWRPAECDDWRLNDGTEQTGQVDIVFRSGDVMPACDSEDMGWGVFDDELSILWWRPSAEPEDAEAVPQEPNAEPKRKIYIAGPMTGIEYFNFPAFDAAKEELELAGWYVISPADLDRQVGLDPTSLPSDTDWRDLDSLGFSLEDAIDRDISAIKECSAIYMLDGWERSKGANAEIALAKWRGIEVLYQSESSEVPQEPKAEPEHDGWIPCTADNEPPEGFRFDVMAAGNLCVMSSCLEERKPWADRVKRKDSWRPAKPDGWQLNDGTEPTGRVEYVCRNGVVDSEGIHSDELDWSLNDNYWTIIWWRPSEDVAEEDVPQKQIAAPTEPPPLGELIAACDEHSRAAKRLTSANKAIRDKMGNRERVVMWHDGKLHLVEWDDLLTLSWQQIDEI